MLEQERERFDEDLRRLTMAAAYLREHSCQSAAPEEGGGVLLLGTENLSNSTYATQKPRVIISL